MRELAERLQIINDLRNDATRIKPVLKVAHETLRDMSEIFGALESGDQQKLERAMTKWKDVNATLLAIADMDAELKKSNFDWEAGFEKVMRVIGIGLKVAALAGI